MPTKKRPHVSAPVARVTLDPHQARMARVIAGRLGGTTDEVAEFLLTVGLYALALDEDAYHRVSDGIEKMYGDEELSSRVMGMLADGDVNIRNEVGHPFAEQERPRMFGDWRGGQPRPEA